MKTIKGFKGFNWDECEGDESSLQYSSPGED